MTATDRALELPAPPYPATTRSRGWYFALNIPQICQSSTWTLAGRVPGLRNVLLRLWMESWQQCPMGSLPDDDEVISALIEYPLGLFTEHRSILLRGWRKASDGRYYHAVITELVRGRIEHMADEKARKTEWRRQKLAAEAAQAAEQETIDDSSRGTGRDEHGKDGSGADAGAGAGAGAGEPLSQDQKSTVGLAPDLAAKEAGLREIRAAAVRVIAQLNKLAGRRYEPVEANVRHIVARLREGYTETELRSICAVMTRKWKGNERMDDYLRPKTLFNETNAAQYRALLPTSKVSDEGLS